jgi:hypothetical protein
MDDRQYTSCILVDASTEDAFNCIKNPTKWWTENVTGSSQKTGDEFTVRFGDVHYSNQKLIEVIPGKKVVWLVTDSKLNFVKNKEEWTNTQISFEISSENGKTKIVFIHKGLTPGVECFDACSNAWSQYIQGSLLKLVNTGEGQPDAKVS